MHFGLLLVVFIFLFGPRLQGLDLHSVGVVLAALAGLLFILRDKYLPKQIFVLFFAYWPLIFYACVIAILHGSADSTMAWIYLKSILYLLGAWGVVRFAYVACDRDFSKQLFLSIWVSCVLNGLFVIAMIVSPALRLFAASVLDLSGKDHWVEGGYRSFDVSMGGGAIASIIFAVALFSGIISRKALPNSAVFALGSYILAMATILTGRTGSLMIAVGAIVLLAWMSIRILTGKFEFRRSLSVVFYVGLPIPVLIGVLVFGGNETVVDTLTSQVIPWAFEGLSIGQGGELAFVANSSLSNLFESMFFLPDDIQTLFFGSSNSGRSAFLPYLATDVGYLRVLNSVGVLGLLLASIPYCVKAVVATSGARSSIEGLPILIMLVAFAVANAKELVLAPRGGAAMLAIWFCSLALQMDSQRFTRSLTKSSPSKYERLPVYEKG